MEARKIIIVETRRQKKTTIMSAATTLGELKADLRDNNIDYTDMTFYEGLTKSELKFNESLLPHDVPYKGTVTNELVFMLTNTNKKIKSGANKLSRLDIYRQIRELNLVEVCKQTYGKNFTMCKTTDLLKLIDDTTKGHSNTSETKSKKAEDEVKTEPKVESKECSKCECNDSNIRKALVKLIDLLEENSCLSTFDCMIVKEILNEDTEDTCQKEEDINSSPYSNSEIDAMFAGMNI